MKIQIKIDDITELTIDNKNQNLLKPDFRWSHDAMHAYDAGTYAGYFRLLRMGVLDMDTIVSISAHPREDLEEMSKFWANTSPLEQMEEIDKRSHALEAKFNELMKQRQANGRNGSV